jgi:hypothetical protein
VTTRLDVVLVVAALASLALVGLVGIVLLSFYGRQVDPSLVAMASAAAGALASMLARTTTAPGERDK